MARIDSAYNYYMSTYANKEVSRYDSHKKSDLRKIYNQIHAEYAKKLGDIRKAEPVVDEEWARKFLMAQGQV